jgi:hypothetical protein
MNGGGFATLLCAVLPACKIDSDAGQQIFIFENW